MSTNVPDAQHFISLAAEKDLSIGINHVMQFHSCSVKAASVITSHAVGTVNDEVFHMEFRLGLDRVISKAWRSAAGDERGGPISDVASHCFYSLEVVLGSPIVLLAAVYFRRPDKRSLKTVRSFSDARGCERGMAANMGDEVYGDAGVLRAYGTLFQGSGHDGEFVKRRPESDDFERDKQHLRGGCTPARGVGAAGATAQPRALRGCARIRPEWREDRRNSVAHGQPSASQATVRARSCDSGRPPTV
jgi:predicted dehydrogenase